MKRLLAVLLLSSFAYGQDSKSCVIVRTHQKKASEALFRWTQPKPFDYVEGQYPKNAKFHYEIGDKTIRQIQASGGKVVIMKADYSMPELEDARKQCKEFQEQK
jgi:hypothetical protein